jgi:DNA-binding NarL/FixJ family response regulator
MREGLAAMLAEQPDLEVVGQAGNGRDAISLARKLAPDVVVMDAVMPVLDGEQAARQIKADLPTVRIIALSMAEDKRAYRAMLEAGAERYLSKADPSDRLVAAIRTGPCVQTAEPPSRRG